MSLLTDLDEAVRLLRVQAGAAPPVAIVLGSGLGPFADTLSTPVVMPYEMIPHWPASAVVGHAGRLVVGAHRSGWRVAVLSGRVHLYEGHPPASVVFGVRAMARWGVRVLLLTNAAGGVREGLSVGQPVLISDHLNLTARSPLEGARFVDLVDLYSARLRALVRSVDPSIEEGVYAALPGPHYETPAEIRMLRTMGADLVGMSTALEAIAAREAGMEVLGFSLITNLAAGIQQTPLSHAEVIEAGREAEPVISRLLADVVAATGRR